MGHASNELRRVFEATTSFTNQVESVVEKERFHVGKCEEQVVKMKELCRVQEKIIREMQNGKEDSKELKAALRKNEDCEKKF